VYAEGTARKRAALLFDRQYLDPSLRRDSDIPEEMTFAFPALDAAVSRKEELVEIALRLLNGLDAVSPKELVEKLAIDAPELLMMAVGIVSAIGGDEKRRQRIGEEVVAGIIDATWRLFGRFDLPVVRLFSVPTFTSLVPAAASLGPKLAVSFMAGGDSVAFVAAMSMIPEVAEQHLSWDQIREFRDDSDALRKYRALKSWLQTAINAKTLSEAEDIIAQKLENYEWAIRKHGLRTVTGGLAAVLASDSLASIAAGAGIAALLHRPIWALISTGLIAGTKAALWVAERKIDLRDVKYGPNSEVALLYEARRLAERQSAGRASRLARHRGA
jgi:hypothetical protein